jgi:hypothetical protein
MIIHIKRFKRIPADGKALKSKENVVPLYQLRKLSKQ